MYVKLFEQILDSSIAENYKTRLVFEDMLLLADRNGIVDMTHEALSRRTNIPIEIVKAAITELEQPDSRSRRADYDGSRIIRLDDHRDWGWHIVNFDYYRKLRNDEERTEYMRDYIKSYRKNGRDKSRLVNNGKQTLARLANADADAESDSDKNKNLSTKVDGLAVQQSDFNEFWSAYPRKQGKKAALKAWNKATDKPEITQILRQLAIQKQSDQWKKEGGQFIPMPATWINGGRWMDEQPVKTTIATRDHPISEQAAFEKAGREIVHLLYESAVAGGESVSRCLQACRDKYRDTPKWQGKDAVSEAYSVWKFRNGKAKI